MNEVSIGKNLNSIDTNPWLGAFVGCDNIKKLSINCIRLDLLELPSELKSNLEELIIGDETVTIGYYTFSGSGNLKKVTIGKNIGRVEGFGGCTSLEEVIFSEGNLIVGEDAFWGCTKLSEISFPSTLIQIGGRAFCECGFEVLNVPESVSWLGYGAFQDCANLNTINIPSKITHLEDYLLSGTGLQSFDIPSHVTSLGMGVFSGCTKLESLTASKNLISIGRGAFADSPWYDNQDDGVFYLGSVACGYHGEMPENTTIQLKDNTYGIAGDAFSGLSNLSGIVIPEGLRNIGDAAFYNSGLSSVTIPKSIVNLGCETFCGCKNLKKIVLYNLPYYGCYNFFDCINLKEIYAYMEQPDPLDNYYFYDDSGANWDVYSNATLYVPVEYISIYENTEGWNKFSNIEKIVEKTEIIFNGISTYFSTYDVDFSSYDNFKAYIASGFSPSTGELLLTRIYKVPAGEGVLLKGEAGDYEVPYGETDMVYSNLLKGVTTATTISPTDGDYTNFILANGSHGIGFYTLSHAGEIAAGKAYLQLPTSAISSNGARGLTMRFDDEDSTPLALEEVANHESIADEYYDLQGRRIVKSKYVNSQLTRGLYIMRSADGRLQGKKVFVR